MHCGGQLGAMLKYSGHDGLIIEGKADKPCYIFIDDDKISIEDASALWGKGTRETTEALCKKHGAECCVAAIGLAGENLLPYACVMNTRSHSAGAGWVPSSDPRTSRPSSSAAPRPATSPTRRWSPTCPTT